MDLEQFKQSVAQNNQPDTSLKASLQALWWDAKGDWDKAHELCQQEGNAEGAWVHAYLHRKEGDEGNASYWYSRAKKTKPKTSLEQEWGDIAQTLLQG